jgi:hypothetical protein
VETIPTFNRSTTELIFKVLSFGTAFRRTKHGISALTRTANLTAQRHHFLGRTIATNMSLLRDEI